MKIWLLAWTPALGFLAMSIAQLFNMTIGTQQWVGEPLLSAEWAATALYLVGPLFSAAAALDGARLFPLGNSTVWNQDGVRKDLMLRLWAVSSTCTAFPMLIVVVYMGLRARPTFAASELSALLVIVGNIATIAILIGLGLLLGRTLGMLYGVLLAAATAFFLQIVSSAESASVLQFGGALGSMLGLRLSWLSMIAIVIGSLLCLLLLWSGLRAKQGFRFVRHASFAGLASSVAVVLVLAVVPMAGMVRYEVVENLDDSYGCSPPMSSAAFSRGKICIYNEHDRLMARIDRLWTDLSVAAVKSGATQFPENLREVPSAADPDNFTFDSTGRTAYYAFVSSEMAGSGNKIDVAWLIDEIVQVPWCPAVWSDDGADPRFHETVEEARRALTDVAQSRSQTRQKTASREFDSAWEKLRACEGAR